MFHWATGVPFNTVEHSGAYDDLTLWEQIDGGAQYTPAKKRLFITPIALSVFHVKLYFQILTDIQILNIYALHSLRTLDFRNLFYCTSD